MLKKTIKYVDYNGNPREEDCYFNLTRTELLQLDLTSEGSFQDLVHKIIQTQDKKALWHLFKEIVLTSYGEKSLDGKKFIKSSELAAEFACTPMFDELMVELCSGEEAVNKFIDGIMPIDLNEGTRQGVAPIK